MIAKLNGVLDSMGADWAVVDVGGIGYLVYCSARTLHQLPGPGGTVVMLIETHVREDHIHLYGFADSRERDWFAILQAVQGVGARVALGILSALSPIEVMQAIAAQDAQPLTQASGVGAKLANRIVTELKDKAPSLAAVPLPREGAAEPAEGAASGAAADAVSALTNLGYRRVDAFSAVANAARTLGAEVEVEALIRGSLRELGR